MPTLKLIATDINKIELRVLRRGQRLIRIYRSNRAAGPYDEVGLAGDDAFSDISVEPGRTYYYRCEAVKSRHFPRDEGAWTDSALKVATQRGARTQASVVTRKRDTFTVRLRGFLDESNTVTRGPDVYCPGPNASMPP